MRIDRIGWGIAALVALGALAPDEAARAAETPPAGAASGQVPHVLIVGPTDNYANLIAGISQGVQAGGFPDASKVRLDVQNVKSFAQAKQTVTAALGVGADVVVAVFGQSTRAARDATATVPIVFCPVADPVQAKYVESLEAPGGNLTGVASADPKAVGERLDAFRQLLPALRRLAVFYDSTSSLDKTVLANLEQTAPARGLRIVPREVADPDHARQVLRELDRSQADAVFFLGDAFLRRAGEAIGGVALERALPILVGDPDIEAPAVVVAIGPNQEKMGRICGEAAARILKGAKPAAIPVAHPPFDLVVSLKQAQALGLKVPEAALARATRVIR
jgi:putative tryptophan/tyrosine transport system substrate-binding protein